MSKELITRIVREVAELPDRHSPEDWPEAMLVTANELGEIVRRAIRESRPAPAVQVPEGMVLVRLEPTDEMVNRGMDAALQCEYADGWDELSGCEQAAAETRAAYLAMLASPAVPVGDGWIAVGDRLPEPQTDVLIFARHHQRPHVAQVMVAGLFGPHNNPRELEWMDNVSESMIPRRWWVTHWQPLPAAPAIANREEK